MLYLDESEIIAVCATEVPYSGRTMSGYGKRLPSIYKIKLKDKKWRRVRFICYSNSGTAYVIVKGITHYLSSTINLSHAMELL